jgi:Creatinase/Prolidase N-terminal domain
MAQRRAALADIVLPDFGEPGTEPELGAPVYRARLDRLRARMAAASFDAMVVYGDREHLANICWLTGYDPRFEEAICIVAPGRTPQLLSGNEGFPYSELAPGVFDRVLWQPLSLMGQPRDQVRPLAELLAGAGLQSGMRIGLAGWKGYETEAGEFDASWFETPEYLVSALRAFGPVRNAADLFMNPADGLRAINETDQLARFEFAATLSSQSIKRLILGARPGMSEYDAARAIGANGFMQSIHMNFCSGPRAKYGLPSPSFRVLERGDPIVAGMGLMGALNCRAGFLAESAADLPAAIQDYVERLVAPYFEAAAAWYETIGIGVTGGQVYESAMSRVGAPFFGVGLNPGHLIHLDEWLHSPMKKAGMIELRSGMALQCDIIPATGTAYFTANIEDGVALADAALREEFAVNHPEAWTRIEARRRFMIETLGIRLRPEVLPFSNLAAWLPPFWLSPGKAMAMRDV